MKKIILNLFTLLALVTMASCGNKDSEGLTSVNYYPKIIMNGDKFFISPLGTAYQDKGATVTLNGEDYTSNLVTSGLNQIDINTAGLYYVTYSATSPDGYSWSEKRTVAVCDPAITTDISGTYTTLDGTRRLRTGVETPYPGYTTKLSKVAPGIFLISDMLGGYYDQRAAYGTDFTLKGYVQLLADGTVKALSGKVAAWGDSYDSFTGNYDAKTGRISYVVNYAGMDFYVVLGK